MSLPREQAVALIQARQFLLSLCIPQETPRVPRVIRAQARNRLKHFPMSWDWERIVDDFDAMKQARDAETFYLKRVWGDK
jgi:hypothetical protein